MPDPYLTSAARALTRHRADRPPCPTPTRQVAAIQAAINRAERANLPALVPQRRRQRDRATAGSRACCARCSAGSRARRAPISQTVLEDGALGDGGFSPQERAMLTNILALRERRVEDVMVPRADIIAVQQDISLGELIKVFESAGHSRLVVYNDTLDDPVGMVHIRDLIGFMVRARSDGAAKTQAQEAVPGRPRSQGDRSLDAASSTRRSSARSCSCRPRCRRSICSPRCRRPASIWRW